jgi:hypothetical protein
MFLFAVVHTGADFLYVGVSCQIRNLVLMQCDKHSVYSMRLMTAKILSTDLRLC